MQWRPFAVLFSIALFVLALPLAATAQAAPTTLTTDATDTATLPDGTISDTATLNAPDSTNGSIEFRLYGPFTTAPTATDCTAAKLIAGAGSTVPVTDHTAAANPYTSTAFTPTAPGIYQWTAQFTSTTQGVNSTAEFGCSVAAEQSSVVNQAGPTLATQASGPVTVGSAISDTATLSGATNDAGGTITFKLYSTLADCQAGTNEITTDLQPVTVNGNGNYNSGDFTPSAPGTYFWTAEYSGDVNNDPADEKSCAANEQSVVNGEATPTLTTDATDTATLPDGTISDVATLDVPEGTTGTIEFKLYGPFTTAPTATDCTTPIEGAGSMKTVTAFDPANPTYTSDPYTPTEAGIYNWTASFTPDPGQGDPSGEIGCGETAEQSVGSDGGGGNGGGGGGGGGGGNGGGRNNNDGRHRHHDRDRDRHHDRDRHNNRFFGRGDFAGGAAHRQYERIVEERVIKETIPNKGTLANTGGMPLAGVAFLSLAMVGLGSSVLRSAIRPER